MNNQSYNTKEYKELLKKYNELESKYNKLEKDYNNLDNECQKKARLFLDLVKLKLKDTFTEQQLI